MAFIVVYINKNSISNVIQCSPINNFLFKKTYHIGIKLHPAYVYGDLSFDYINDLCIQISKTNLNTYSFYINQFNDKFNNPFSRKSPFSHPNVIINDFCLFDSNIIITLTSSHENYNNFNFLSNNDFINNTQPQFISNSFHFLQKDLFTEKFSKNFYEIIDDQKINLNKQINFTKSNYIFKNK